MIRIMPYSHYYWVSGPPNLSPTRGDQAVDAYLVDVPSICFDPCPAQAEEAAPFPLLRT